MTIRYSPMEEKVIERLAVMTPDQIAKQLGIEVNTVYTYLKRARRKYKQARTFVNMVDGKYRSRENYRKYLWLKD